jgi:glycosyltransferase involved in cell wall biosynthesis
VTLKDKTNDVLRFGAVLPHTKLYGGIKRFFELGNQFVQMGHSMTLFTPAGENADWFDFTGNIAPHSSLHDYPLDAIFFTELSLLPLVLKSLAHRKIYYIVNPSVNLRKIKKYKEIEFFANSGNLLKKSRSKYGIDAFPALGGINIDNFPVKKRNTLDPGSPFTVMAYGRIAEGRKGTMFVVRACERLLKMGFKVNLLMFDTPVSPNIQKAIDSFRTPVPYELILNHPVNKNVELYHKADIFVAPEKKTGYANTVVEAMASGIPVIASTSGTHDVLFHEKTGLVVSRNSRSIRDAIIKLIQNSDLCNELTLNARKTVMNFSWDILAAKIIDHLKVKN